MRSPLRFSHLLALVAVFFLFAIASPPRAHAGYEVITVTKTMALGTSSTSIAVPMKNVCIRDVIVFVPTLDSGDTSTVTLTSTALGTTYVPRGWSNKGVGATEDNAIIQCNASQLSIISGDTVTVGLLTSTNQAAARTFKIQIQIEN